MFKNYTFTIVIPSLNEESYIGNCVDSILAQDYDKDLIEIVIVDGYSTDNTLKIIEEYQKKHKNIRLLYNKEKRTPISLNIGIKNAKSEFVVILGAHTQIDKEFVKYNNKYINEKGVRCCGGTQKNVGLTYKQSLVGTVMEMPFAMATAAYRWSNKEQFVDTVVYAAYDKTLFDELGYFEEKFAISEDSEMNWRIRNAGYKIFYSPKIKTDYYPRASVKKFIKQMFRYGVLRVNMFKKHNNALTIKHIVPPMFSGSIIALAVAGIFAGEAWYALGGMLGFYFLVNIVATIMKTFPNKLKFLPALPLLVFALQFAWGLGFIVGAVLPKSEKY